MTQEDDRAGRVGNRGPRRWVDVRGARAGGWAFTVHRITGLGLLFYLYLHLAVLFLLTRGEEGWNRFVDLARTPLLLSLDVLLIAGLLFHGLNGIRVALIGSGLVVARRRALLIAVLVVGGIVVVYSALKVFEMGAGR